MVRWRKKLSASEQAEQIKARHLARLSANQDLFSSAQREKMAELGLTPGAPHTPPEQVTAKKRVRDPLTKRQRKLMEELGLATPPASEANEATD